MPQLWEGVFLHMQAAVSAVCPFLLRIYEFDIIVKSAFASESGYFSVQDFVSFIAHVAHRVGFEEMATVRKYANGSVI